MLNFGKKIKDTASDYLEDIKEEISDDNIGFNTFAFISLNNGAGTKTMLENIAQVVSKKKRVGIFDADFFQPSLVTIEKDKSILGYFNEGKDIHECIVQHETNKNIWYISTSYEDAPIDMADIEIEHFDGKGMMSNLAEYLKNSFDYLLINMKYNPLVPWFVNLMEYVDRGYIVWDEHPDNIIKTKIMLDFVDSISYYGKKSNINNIILNKKTEMAYPYAIISEIECNLVAEIPLLKDIMLAKNEGRIYIDSSSVDKRFKEEIDKLISQMTRSMLG